jgi:hypothetical protein
MGIIGLLNWLTKMNSDKLTTIAGFAGMAGFVIDGAIQGGLVPVELAPVVKAGQGFALALVAWYVGKPIGVKVR